LRSPDGERVGSSKASQASVTLGSALAVEPTTIDTCTNLNTGRGCFAVNDSIPGRLLAAPSSGVIVRWRTRVATETDAQSIRIRILQRLGPKKFKIVSSGLLEPIPAGAGTYTFPAAVPIASGEEVGLEAESGKHIEYQAPSPEAHSFVFNLEPDVDNSETPPPVFDNPGLEATFNVDVEPDCDNDGLGDETQDLDTSTCAQPAQPSKPSNAFILGKPKLNTKKGIARERVTVPGPGNLTLTGKQVVTASAAVSAAGTVNLMVKSKGKKKRKLLKRGKVKVKIVVTYTPTGGTPSSVGRKLNLKKRLH
jgi:hypothetical protein